MHKAGGYWLSKSEVSSSGGAKKHSTFDIQDSKILNYITLSYSKTPVCISETINDTKYA